MRAGRFAAVTAAIVVLLVAGSGYWFLDMHQRIGPGAVEQKVAGAVHSRKAVCLKTKGNGAQWICVVHRPRRQGSGGQPRAKTCYIVHVNPFGSIKQRPGYGRCKSTSGLPRRI